MPFQIRWITETFLPTNIVGLSFTSLFLSYIYIYIYVMVLPPMCAKCTSCYFLAITLYVHSFLLSTQNMYKGILIRRHILVFQTWHNLHISLSSYNVKALDPSPILGNPKTHHSIAIHFYKFIDFRFCQASPTSELDITSFKF